MTARIGDRIVLSQTLDRPASEGEVREVRDGPDGVVYLVRWSDTGYESLLRPGPNMMIKDGPAGETSPIPDHPRLYWLLHPLEWRHRRERQRERQARDEYLAWRVEHILAGLNLTHTDFTVGAGRMVHVPEAVAVTAGPPVGVEIRMLPGQTPDDFAAHAPAIAYNLGVARIRIVPLGPCRIRLELLPLDTRLGASAHRTAPSGPRTAVSRLIPGAEQISADD